MQQSISDYVMAQTQRSLIEDSGYEPDTMKAFSVRLPEKYVNLLDKIAENINVSRNTLISEIVCKGAEEALHGYASCFCDPSDVANSMRAEAGFNTEWHKPSQD